MSNKYKRQTRQIAATPKSVATVQTAAPARQAFNPDYAYVIKDLRRIGLLAGSFIALLVILSFVLR